VVVQHAQPVVIVQQKLVQQQPVQLVHTHQPQVKVHVQHVQTAKPQVAQAKQVVMQPALTRVVLAQTDGKQQHGVQIL
jgi:hypothetical protein